MSNEEKIKIIEKCIGNKFFYNCKDFLYDNTELILKYVDTVLTFFEQYQIDLKSTQNNEILFYEEILDIIIKYFKNKNINVAELFNNGTISFEETNSNNHNGVSFMQKGQKLIDIYSLDSNITPGVIVHEIYHYLNQNEQNSFVRELLTEAVSYSEGLIFFDEYFQDNQNLLVDEIKNIIYGIFHTGNALYTIYTFIDCYRKNGKIERKYFKCNDDKYNKQIDRMYLTLQTNDNLFRIVWDFVGFSMGLYLYARYKEEQTFEMKIDLVSSSLDYFDIITCLNYWGITSIDDIFPKIKKYYKLLFLDILKNSVDDVKAKQETSSTEF